MKTSMPSCWYLFTLASIPRVLAEAGREGEHAEAKAREEWLTCVSSSSPPSHLRGKEGKATCHSEPLVTVLIEFLKKKRASLSVARSGGDRQLVSHVRLSNPERWSYVRSNYKWAKQPKSVKYKRTRYFFRSSFTLIYLSNRWIKEIKMLTNINYQVNEKVKYVPSANKKKLTQ